MPKHHKNLLWYRDSILCISLLCFLMWEITLSTALEMALSKSDQSLPSHLLRVFVTNQKEGRTTRPFPTSTKMPILALKRVKIQDRVNTHYTYMEEKVKAMANPEHLDLLLKQEIAIWNHWRKDHPAMQPDLSEARLSEAHLSEANLSEADLSGAYLIEANLRGADLSLANLKGAYLIEADLSGANLKGASLSGAFLRRARLRGASLREAHLSGVNLNEADLSQAKLTKADLSSADLSRANLSEADISKTNLIQARLSGASLKDTNLCEARLSAADLSSADLSGADLYKASVGRTLFGNVDFRHVKGLQALIHHGPSTIGIDTIYRSQGQIPENFLRKAGVPETFLMNMRALVESMSPIDYYSCFISYSSEDQAFADRLYTDLQSNGVLCWFALEDMKIGDEIRTRIDESIRMYDKLLLVLSEHSISSIWVKDEVEAAFEKEAQQGTQVLFPIALDNTIKHTDQPWAATIRRRKHIGDFTKWKSHDDYHQAFERLLRDLQAESSPETP